IGSFLSSTFAATLGASGRAAGSTAGFGITGAGKTFTGRAGGVSATTFGNGSGSGSLISGAGITIICFGPGRSFGPATIVWLNFSLARGGWELLRGACDPISGSLSRKLYQIRCFSCG